MKDAISREKQIEGGLRAKKIELMNGMKQDGSSSMTAYEIATSFHSSQ